MICDNCGADIDNKERYCPNCGMELPTKSSKKKYYKNSRPATRDNFQPRKNRDYPTEEHFEKKPFKKRDEDPADSIYYIPHPKADYSNHNEEEDYKRKPLKRKYYGRSASSRYDSPYQDDLDYESYYDYGNEEVPKAKKSRISLGTICLFMVMILLLGFVIGLIMFSNQSIPHVPGFNS